MTKLNNKIEKQLKDLFMETIYPALHEDFIFSSQDEYKQAIQSLIEMLEVAKQEDYESL